MNLIPQATGHEALPAVTTVSITKVIENKPQVCYSSGGEFLCE